MNILRVTLCFALLGVAAACSGEAPEGGGTGGDATSEITGFCGPLPDGGSFRYTFAGANGETAECDQVEYEQHQIVIEGAIRGSLEQGWVIDSCAPNADCAPIESMITVQADELEIAIPEGAFVRATMTTEFSGVPGMGGSCLSHLVIENLPVWSGLPNPVSAAPGASELGLWLAGHDGTTLGQVDAFTVTPEAVCTLLESFSGSERAYDLRFDSPNAQGSAVSVPWGQTADWIVGEGPMAGQYRARNLHALDVCCHAPGIRYAYWVARAPAP